MTGLEGTEVLHLPCTAVGVLWSLPELWWASILHPELSRGNLCQAHCEATTPTLVLTGIDELYLPFLPY